MDTFGCGMAHRGMRFLRLQAAGDLEDIRVVLVRLDLPVVKALQVSGVVLAIGVAQDIPVVRDILVALDLQVAQDIPVVLDLQDQQVLQVVT